MRRSLFFGVLLAASLPAQQRPAITTVEITDSIYMLMGYGGNIGVSVGDDGTFLIDDQFAPGVRQVKDAVAKLTDQPIKFVANTHWHRDHTGGNEAFAKGGALVVAHRNVRKRMSQGQFMELFQNQIPPAAEAALPIITLTRDLTLHWNGEEIRAFHVSNAHTDGDVVYHFVNANVIHTGDVFFHEAFPFIDESSGGSARGIVAAVDRVLEVADDETKIIPGHGKLATKKDLQGYRDALVKIFDRVRGMVRDGKSLEDVLSARPSKEWDAWGEGFMKTDVWLGIVYRSIDAELREISAADQDK